LSLVCAAPARLAGRAGCEFVLVVDGQVREGSPVAARRRERRWPRPLRRARRLAPVIPSAAIRTTPVNIAGAQLGAETKPSPTTPVPSSSTAISVPQALKRPGRSWLAPRKAAAYAESR